jgi:hypothetical protein
MLRNYCERVHPEAKADLATCFLERCLEYCMSAGTVAVVTPQNWLFLGTYRNLRRTLLKEKCLDALAALGPRSFATISGEVVNVALVTITASPPRAHDFFAALDANDGMDRDAKAGILRKGPIAVLRQVDELHNPDSRIATSPPAHLPTLSKYADVFVGFQNGDTPRWVHSFWEHCAFEDGWEPFHATPERAGQFEGFDAALKWDGGRGQLASSEQVYVKGREAWGKRGVLCRQTQPWPTSLYLGTLYDQSSSVLIPKSDNLLVPLHCFAASDVFRAAMLSIANAMKFTNSTFVKVPFDLAHWQGVAAEKYPQGLPEPQSNDPTQWVFHGHPAGMVATGPASASPFGIADLVGADRHRSAICRTPNVGAVLQVAAARLVGYRWPTEVEKEVRLDVAARAWVERCKELAGLAGAHSIVCIPPVLGEQSAADGLQQVLAHAFGSAWTPAILAALVEEGGFSGSTVESWLRDSFFEQHCQLFHQRPFVWHIWDGRRRDGFAALVNYHRLDRKLLERLAYTVLGDWIARQRQDVKAGERGAEDRLAAALTLQQKLALILEGDSPHDIFVRWKPIHEQPIGWEPDLNDGVRVNVRPFVEAGVLRKNPKIQWTKDRGREPESLRPKKQFPWFWRDGHFTGERVNDVHLINAEKRAARDRIARERSTGR